MRNASVRVTVVGPILLVAVACGGGGPGETRTAPVEESTTGGEPAATPVDCVGHFEGVGVQEEGPPWTIAIDLGTPTETGACGTIEYPSLGCGGQLVGCEPMPDGRLHMVEMYDHNPGTCAPPGQLFVMCSTSPDGITTMLWTWEGEGGPVTTTLTRL